MHTNVHVLVVAIPAFGHIVPMLELAKKITRFHRVTFAVSASKVIQMKDRDMLNENDALAIHSIPDGLDSDLDSLMAEHDHAGVEAFFDIVFTSFVRLFNEMPISDNVDGVTGSLEGSDTISLHNGSVDVVIAVNFAGSQAAICHDRGVPFYLFNPENAVLLQNILSIRDDHPTVPAEEADPFWRLPEPDQPPRPISQMIKNMWLPLRKKLHLASGIIINSCRELEMDALKEVMKMPEMSEMSVFCVGPLFPEEVADVVVKKNATRAAVQTEVLKWLDEKANGTVIYVSFGSIAAPTPDQVKTIGLALSALNRPIIWSLRKNLAFLPAEITTDSNCKFFILPWAPQKLILSHASVGVFLSHCGWNSTLEGLASGKPIVAWPMFVDQLLNAQLILKLGVGVMISRTDVKPEKGVSVEEIKSAIQAVSGMGGEGLQKPDYAETARLWGGKVGTAWSQSRSSSGEFLQLVKFQPLKL
ncbi:putative UDP-glycosyltransferase 72B1 [Hypsibius exemplaris]|uniref:UDP-glucuronosyltransferase n=1 Tax=Hypsibius exemplaris TaxID=2072580 RepID=A0A1W0WR99_HYPEX|nr:putative UDP-glycosyltransferase 72B1 [Hypsibius exemplaris]